MICTCGHAMQAHRWVPHHYAHCGICLTCRRSRDEHDHVTTHQMNACPCATYTPRKEQQ